MSGGHVTSEEFRTYVQMQGELSKTSMKNLNDVLAEVKDTNALLRTDINQNKELLQSHISQYNTDKAITSKDIMEIKNQTASISNIVSEREDVYRAGKTLKWVFAAIMTASVSILVARIFGAT